MKGHTQLKIWPLASLTFVVKPRNEEYVTARTSFSPQNNIKLGCFLIQIKATNMEFLLWDLIFYLPYLSRLICYYADCSYTECRCAKCHYAECRNAKCHYAECRYVECRVALFSLKIFFNYFYAKIQTLDLRIVSQMFDHCATTKAI